MRENGCSGKLCPMQVGSVDNCKLTKEQCPYFTQDVDYQAILQVIRSELAREIFAEIETKAPFFCENQVAYDHFNEELAELKKKYTEGE